MRTPFRKSHGKITFILYTKPYQCGGSCLYCFRTKGFTASTTSNEDTELAKIANWSGLKQIAKRFEIYKLNSSIGNKCDLAIKGDSFANHSADYLRSYFKEIYDFLNGKKSNSLREATYLQKNGKNRCVTLKVETRPDHINIETCNLLLELGVTTVELGVQILDEEILKINKRGHGLQDIDNATKLLKLFGFEVVYQIMVGLPGSNLAKDRLMLTEKLWQEQYNPDALKIYPCLLLKSSVTNQKQLFNLYNKGFWKPINDTEYIELLKNSYDKIPRYVHINRIQRVIPTEKIEAGVKENIARNIFSNISQCLWQRSFAQKLSGFDFENRNYEIHYYPQGSNGYCFEVINNRDVLLGYGRINISINYATIRDIRVLGDMIPVNTSNDIKTGWQHNGIGTNLLKKMESVALCYNINYVIVKPSFGTFKWFEQNGYNNIGTYYMGKNIVNNPTRTKLPYDIQKMINNNLLNI